MIGSRSGISLEMRNFGLRMTPTAMGLQANLHPDIKKSIRVALKEIVMAPYSGKALQAELDRYSSYRTRRYRIIYRVNESEQYIEVIHIGHRRDVYAHLRSILQIPPV